MKVTTRMMIPINLTNPAELSGLIVEHIRQQFTITNNSFMNAKKLSTCVFSGLSTTVKKSLRKENPVNTREENLGDWLK